MIKPNDYEEVQAVIAGQTERLELGGHICIINKAYEAKAKTGKEMLVVEFDIAGDDKQAGYFTRQILDRGLDRWPNAGIYRTSPIGNDGKTNKFFKGFITSIEASNQGYTFDFSNIEGLVGKVFGGVFGLEEYEGNSGRGKAVKMRYVQSTENIYDAKIPNEKLLPEQKEDETPVEDDYADLPF